MGGVSPLGSEWKVVRERLRAEKSAVVRVDDLGRYEGLNTRLGVIVDDFEVPASYPRKKLRSMGRVAVLATRATELALIEAGLLDSLALGDGTTGISHGSTSGTPGVLGVYSRMFAEAPSLKGIRGSDYVKLMSHTTAANLAQFFEIRGRVIPTCSACASGSQGVGYGYESILLGKHDVMVTGGSEEFHALVCAVFDILHATSTRNDAPETTPRPFDRDRDGLVVGEGAGTLILEDLEYAQRRGASILAEMVGYGTSCDGHHITNPDAVGMASAMSLALEDAGIGAEEIGYVNAHGTATDAGDIAESTATENVLGKGKPISSLKSYMGHTLGACGALEAWMTIEMMREGWFAPTLNLKNVDPACGDLDYIGSGGRCIDTEYVMSNNFAFGGVNTSLIFKKWE